LLYTIPPFLDPAFDTSPVKALIYLKYEGVRPEEKSSAVIESGALERHRPPVALSTLNLYAIRRL
jgi:hypothetical protein